MLFRSGHRLVLIAFMADSSKVKWSEAPNLLGLAKLGFRLQPATFAPDLFSPSNKELNINVEIGNKDHDERIAAVKQVATATKNYEEYWVKTNNWWYRLHFLPIRGQYVPGREDFENLEWKQAYRIVVPYGRTDHATSFYPGDRDKPGLWRGVSCFPVKEIGRAHV